MAQALFDEHPLEQYLRDAGEVREFIPGSSVELELELEPLRYTDLDHNDDEQEYEAEWRPLFLIHIMEMILAAASALGVSSHPSPFVERFKYDVISSSLLAVSLPSAHGRPARPSLPGQLQHSRTSSIETQHHASISVTTSDPSYLIPSLSLIIAAVFLNTGYTLLAIASLGITVRSFRAINETSKHDMSSSLEALNDLISASNEWESVVQDAITTLENEESSTSYGSSTPASPTSSIRIALHSSLLTTQTQCDNVRHLFSALTSPTEFSQLSEMYAPPSPSPMTVNISFLSETSPRPFSLPVRRRTFSVPTDPFLIADNKRSTWNGAYSYAMLAQTQTQAGVSSPPPTPTPAHIFRRREKRRSDLSVLLQPTPGTGTVSAPVTPLAPFSPSRTLSFVTEETNNEEDDAKETPEYASDAFGVAALELHRNRKSAGVEAFRLPPPNFSSPLASPPPTPPPRAPLPLPYTQMRTSNSPRAPRPLSLLSSAPGSLTFSPPPSFTASSRLTPVHATRHPLSLSALHHALHSALAAKRYACAHLLALRFAEEEGDEAYWEDVRSVMGLLTSAFGDAAGRLGSALEGMRMLRAREGAVTPSGDEESAAEGESEMREDTERKKSRIGRASMSISFAPLPSHISRFAAHVEGITTALDDARENLDQCVVALKEEKDRSYQTQSQQQNQRGKSSTRSDVEAASPPALEAYERLRRELGLALRECERGRERLLDLVFPHISEDEDEEEADSGEDEDDYLPALGHDVSDDSDKPDPGFPPDVQDEEPEVGVVVQDEDQDDVQQHLLPEQVFEAETGSVAVFRREKSKLTREERIQIAKAKRESGNGLLGVGAGVGAGDNEGELGVRRGVEKWGPGGEVVQELKDVIWKVGERRRRMADTNVNPVANAESVALNEAHAGSIGSS